MVVFLIVLILLLAALGVLGLALKIAVAAFVGLTIAIVAIAAAGYYMLRHQVRKAQRSFSAAASPQRPSAMGGTSVEVGRPTRDDPPVDDRY
jgi:membrane protein implicated in regulation of membrane protease activity